MRVLVRRPNRQTAILYDDAVSVTVTLSEGDTDSLAETTSDIALRFPRYESLVNDAA